MINVKSNILEKIVYGISDIVSIDELKKKINSCKKLNIKLGIDPTGPDLHLGHSILIDKLKIFQEFGHNVILLIGDFTAKIGDPSGKLETRPIMTNEQIETNIKTYTDQIFKILDEKKTEIVYNSKWFDSIDIKEILNLTSKSTVAQMLVRDDFSKRYGENKPISITEFIYPLLQAYDSVVLNADVELGGNDQKFNLLLGRQIQKYYGIKNVQVAIMMPILEGTDGIMKMSKSYDNYISLNDSPVDMFGKIMSISDTLMYKYYKFLTYENLNTVINLHPMDAKIKLAEKIVEKYHDEKKALKAKDEFNRIFSRKKNPSNIEEYRVKKIGIKLSELLIESGMAESKNKVKRFIEQGSIKMNSKKIFSDFFINQKESFILQVGKRKFKKIIL
ncbi:MAG: tyrosine--tRNA ligase [Endomicrobium sp.]|jgi:tyrosyl-tRNA synthetase|nr:tyrosine--tRNA ligase [Endomicrobium sp.]